MNWLTVNTAPCGSRIVAVRAQSPSSVASTAPPLAVASAAVSSRSATANVTCQCAGSPSSAGATQPMASSNPGGTETLAWRSRMSGSVVDSR